jgi:hypothetical protein
MWRAFGDFANDGFGSLSNTFIFFVSPPRLMRIWPCTGAAYFRRIITQKHTVREENKISKIKNLRQLW